MSTESYREVYRRPADVATDVEAVVATRTAPPERQKDHAIYEIEFVPVSNLEPAHPVAFEIQGEWERAAMVDALRWIADRLEDLGGGTGTEPEAKRQRESMRWAGRFGGAW